MSDEEKRRVYLCCELHRAIVGPLQGTFTRKIFALEMASLLKTYLHSFSLIVWRLPKHINHMLLQTSSDRDHRSFVILFLFHNFSLRCLNFVNHKSFIRSECCHVMIAVISAPLNVSSFVVNSAKN